MKKGLEKFLKRMFMDKFPEYLDIIVNERTGWDVTRDEPKNLYEVTLVTKKNDRDLYSKAEKYVYDLSDYMNANVLIVYNEVVSDQEWEKMKSGKESSN